MARTHGAISNKNKPQANVGMPPKPSNLSPRASLEWDRLTRELEKAGIPITPAHRAALAHASTLQADIAAAWEVIKEKGEYEVNTKTGVTQMHPAVKRMDSLRRDLLKQLAILGLKPPAPTGEPAADEESLDDVLEG